LDVDYYPFGLTMAGISSKALKFPYAENKKGFNGNELQNKEFTDGAGLEMYDFNARSYDQQLGRFMQMDPLIEECGQERFSPYHYAYNNPVRFGDPDGKLPIPVLLPVIYKAAEAAILAIAIYITADASAKGASKVIENAPPGNGNSFIPLSAQAARTQYVKSLSKGSNNERTKESIETGQEAHRQIENKLEDEGYKKEVPLELEGGQKVRKDAKKENEVVIIKPDTESGQKSARAREKLMKENNYDVKLIFYDPKDPAYKSGSPSYIGPSSKNKK
jgi:RHS repeat-associated protein